MTRLLREGLEEGAFGYSTGLEYAPEAGATEEEITVPVPRIARGAGRSTPPTRASATRGRWRRSRKHCARPKRRGATANLASAAAQRDGRRAACDRSGRKARAPTAWRSRSTCTPGCYGTTYLATAAADLGARGGGRRRSARACMTRPRATASGVQQHPVSGRRLGAAGAARQRAFPQYARLSLAEIGRLRGRTRTTPLWICSNAAADDLSRPMVIIHCLSEAQQHECFCTSAVHAWFGRDYAGAGRAAGGQRFMAPIAGPHGSGASWCARRAR